MGFFERTVGVASAMVQATSKQGWITIGVAGTLLIGFWVLRRLLTRLITAVCYKMASRTKTSLDNHLIEAFTKPLEWFFALLGLYLALNYLSLKPAADAFISNVFRTGVILLISAGLYNFAGSFEALSEEYEELFGAKVDKILVPFLSKVLKFVIIALAVTVIAQEWDYKIDGLIAGLGLGGLAISLAAKDALANVFGGIVIITDKPFSIGDWIQTPSVEGTVEDISFRSTKVRTFTQALVTVPNSTLASEPITNWSRMGKRRVMFKLGLTYGTSRTQIREFVSAVERLLTSHPEVDQETIVVRFDGFGESSLDILIQFFVKPTALADYARVKEDINLEIMALMEEQGLSVAFPSRSLYFETPATVTPMRPPVAEAEPIKKD